MKKLKIAHNMNDVELEEALEKALKGINKRVETSDAALPSKLSEELREEAFSVFTRVSNNMLREISEVINRKGD